MAGHGTESDQRDPSIDLLYSNHHLTGIVYIGAMYDGPNNLVMDRGHREPLIRVHFLIAIMDNLWWHASSITYIFALSVVTGDFALA